MNIQNMTMPDYLSHKAYGSSDIIKMGHSFAYWKYRKENPEKPSRPLVIGSATHLMLEEAVCGTQNRTDFIPAILIYKDGSSLTNGFKKFQDDNRQHYCLDENEFKLVQRMVDALLSEPEVMGYLKDAVPEATIIANYPGTNILCKCRPDYLHQSKGVSINIKTTTDASESGFIYASKDYQYDWQSVFYCDILTDRLGKSFDEIHILVEKTPENEPIPIKIFSFGEDTLANARFQIRSILEKIPENEKSGTWPKNKVFLESIDLPLHCRKFVNL